MNLQRSYVFIVFLIVICVLYFHSIIKIKNEDHHIPKPKPVKTKESKENITTKVPIVLFYTGYFGRKIWPMPEIGSAMYLNRGENKPCPHLCMITYNKSLIRHSDALIFHEADLPSPDAMRSPNFYRKPTQRWVYFTMENPHNVNHNPSNYNGLFNWTMTYARDSDIFYPYWYYRKIASNEIPVNHSTTNYAKGKDKLIAWAASHCGLLRDQVVRKLLKFLPIQVIGACSSQFQQTSPAFCSKTSASCPTFLKTFKFYLAFENALCTDYVTEKYWATPLNTTMVPIVLGSNYDAKVAIPGSYINIMDYKTIGDLVNHIKYLDRNDTAYNEYFQWKTKFALLKHGERSWTCRLCAKLYNKSLPRKVYNNLGEFHGVKSKCKKPQLMKKIQNIINS